MFIHKYPGKYANECSPLSFTPKLAEKIGITCAIILRQLQYWLFKPGPNYSKLVKACMDSKHRIIENQHWIKESYSTLANRISCFKKITIRVNIKWLKDNDYIFVSNGKYSNQGQSVNWYSINYSKLDSLFSKSVHECKRYSRDTSIPPGDMSKFNRESKGSVNLTPRVISYNNKRNNVSKPGLTNITPSGIANNSPSNEHYNENSNEVNNESKGARKSKISSAPKNQLNTNKSFTDPSCIRIEQAYVNTFGNNLSIKNLNRIHRWLSIWDANLIIIVLHVTATRIDATNDRRVLGYAHSILLDYRMKGILTGKAWHAHKRQALENQQSKYHSQYSSKNDGGTPDDMRNQTFYQQMCRRIARTHTHKVFPPISAKDKQRGDIVVKACDIVMKAKNIPRMSVDYDKLIANDCAIARSLVTNQI